MICTSIQYKDYEQILDILENPFVEMAEIRLDRCELSDEQTGELFSYAEKPLVATCRTAELEGRYGKGAAAEAERRLLLAICSGARFADLEIEADAAFSKRFRSECIENGTEIIRSFHDFEGTPALDSLQMILARCYRYGADIAKIVTTWRRPEDTGTIRRLYDDLPSPGKLTAFCMGEGGRASRLDCLALGAPFTYASLSEGDEAAPGQWTVEEMHGKLYGDFRGFFRNSLEMPASKSFAQRGIIAAALADGRSHLRGYSPCDDSEAAIAVARAIGARVVKRERTLTIDGIGAGQDTKLNLDKLHTGESGLLTRLLIPLSSVLNGKDITITGEKTLETRPLKGIVDILASFGVLASQDRVPITLKGKLVPGKAEISGKDGSQLISGLLMALPLTGKPSQLYVSEPKSIPYMFMTCDVMRHFGIKVPSEMEGDERLTDGQDWAGCSSIGFKIRPSKGYVPADFDIEGDWSSAAPFLVAGAVFGKAEAEGLDCKSLQADISICDILVEAGAIVSQMEEDGTVCVSKAPLEAFSADLNNAPDLFPIVSVLAAFCSGTSTIAGTGRLAGKESDRAAAIVGMLLKLGVPARIEGDELIVEGESLSSRLLNGRLLKGGEYSSWHDHRMAMALKIASIGAESPVIIDDRACVGKSFPEFFEMFD